MPDWKPEISRKLAGLKLRPVREAEIVEELSTHLEDRYAELIASGASRREAERAALEEFRNDESLVKELGAVERPQTADPPVLGASRGGVFGGIGQDLRYALRALLRNPIFTVVSVLILALGIGGNGAIFSIMNAVLLRPLPYPNPDRLVVIFESRPREGVNNNSVAPLDFVDWRARQRGFENIAAVVQNVIDITGEGEPEKIPFTGVSSEYFKVLGLNPMIGRSFQAEDDGKPVVILNEAFWKRRFGSDPKIVGRTIMLNGEPNEVIGVTLAADIQTALWRPLDFRSQDMQTRTNHFLSVWGRLKPGTTIPGAQQDMDRIAAEIQNETPNRNQEHGAHLQPLREQMVGDVQSSLLVLAVAVGFVLLIACANVTNLLLVRGVARHRELAIRNALGASRLRIVRQYAAECFWLALMSVTVGLPIALWGTELLKSIAPGNIPLLNNAALDWTVVGYLMAIALLCAVITGIGPAIQASRIDPNDALKENNPGGGGSRRPLRKILVVSEIALAFILLTGAGLMMRSLWNLLHVQPGFVAESVLTMPISLSRLQTQNRPAPLFMRDITERMRALPGVTAVGMTSHLPLGIADSRTGIAVEGFTPKPGEPTRAHLRFVTPGYFEAMKIQLIAGRLPTDNDTGPNAPRVILVNQTAAKRYWEGRSPIGTRLTIIGESPNSREVIGVIADVKFWGLDQKVNPEAFVPAYRNPANIVVRTQGDPAALAGLMRTQVRELDANLPISTIRPMDDIVGQSVASPRFYLILLIVFGLMAVVLASAGIYGVVSYTVSQRTREIGVKIALGADRRAVLRGVLRQGIVLAAISLAIGIPASIGLTRLMGTLLFGVHPADPVTLAGVTLLTVVIALIACYVPARRAASVDPIIALRYQ